LVKTFKYQTQYKQIVTLSLVGKTIVFSFGIPISTQRSV
jgi:hypothetical protein